MPNIKNDLFKISLKVILIILTATCLSKMSIGYYQFFRWASFVLFGIHLWIDVRDSVYWSAVPAGIGMILFNPIAKIILKRPTWQLIDRATIAILIIWIILDIVLIIYKGQKKRALPF